MSEGAKGSESIFPRKGEMAPHPDRDTYEWTGNVGLTKRELFAAMAMQGLLAGQGYGLCKHAVYDAIKCADALIAELAKERT